MKRYYSLVTIVCMIMATSIQVVAEDTFTVYLPRLGTSLDPNPDCAPYSDTECIEIPDGRPIYALLVSGYYQNKNLDMFHWYNFAKCLQTKGAYVHYAWWNNLLAPYMKRPLHDANSVPGWYATPAHDLNGYVYGMSYPNKALPAEDYQFQKDATALLNAIRQHNPDAAIIIVGHSMGGDAVVRLADSMPDNFKIDLLAPIDPVGNRTEMPLYEWGGGYWCCGYHNFKRYYVVREDWWTTPPHRKLGANIKYLYYRWQTEFLPPFDGTGYIPYGIPIPGAPTQTELLQFDPPRPMATTIGAGSTNVQSKVATSLDSGYDAHPGNSGGWIDGHGEVVGFRGVKPWSEESWALGLDAPHNWPSLDRERSYDDEPNRATVRNLRVSLLKRWEDDPEYFDLHWAPQKPKYEYCQQRGLEGDYCTYCMVSGDLCAILETAVNLPPVADAGPDQTLYANADGYAEVILDGSGSNDPEGDQLTYSWSWTIDGNKYEASGVSPAILLPVGEHQIQLIVDDGSSESDPDDCTVTIIEAIQAEMVCKPDKIRSGSKRGKVFAFLKMPGDIKPEDINKSIPLIFSPGDIESLRMHVHQSKRPQHAECRTWILGVFDRGECMAHLQDGLNEVEVSGQLTSGQYFYGNDTLEIRTPRKRK